MKKLLLGLALGLAATALPIPVAQAIEAPPEGEGVFRFQDGRINESSGLIDFGSVMVTMNDSNPAEIFLVDASSGVTVGTTRYDAEVLDVEAIAPAGPDEVWVGDIGDNFRLRSSIKVYRVPIALRDITVPARTFEFVYPDGPHDSESMFAGPDNRLYFITKEVAGVRASVYRGPSVMRAGQRNELTRVARIGQLATDAAIFGNGLNVVVRGPGTATVYSYPQFKPAGTLRLPRQRQGEGISVGPGNRIRLSTEGARSTVLQVDLSSAVARKMALPGSRGDPTSPSASATPRASATPSAEAAPAVADERPRAEQSGGGWLTFVVPIVVAIGAIGIGIGIGRRRGAGERRAG